MRTSPESFPTAPQTPTGPDHALEKRVGRGAALLTAGKLWFIASGYAIEFALPRIFARAGTSEGKELYGSYGLVTGLAAILNALVYQGTSQAVARFVGRAPEQLAAVQRAAFKLQGWLVGSLFVSMLALAPWIAGAFYEEPSLAAPIRCAAFIMLSFGFYAITMGALTGRQLFRRQALIDAAYSTLKVVCIVGVAIALGRTLGWVESAVLGFALASVLILIVSLLLRPRQPLEGRLRVRELLDFQLYTMVFNLVVTLVARLDLQLLKKLALGSESAVKLAVGDYKAAQALATVPYQAVFAITFVLFPLVSGAAARDPERVRAYTALATRYALVIASLVASCFAGAPEAAVTLLYPADYASAAAPLRLLVLGYLAFSVLYVMTAVLTAAGKPGASLLIVSVVMAVQAGLGAALIPRFGGPGVATATVVAMASGLVAADLVLRRTFGAGLAWSRAVRVLVSAAGAGFFLHLMLGARTLLGRPGFLAGAGLPASAAQRIVTVIVFSAAAALFVALLFLTGGLGGEDAHRFKRVFARSERDAERT